MIWPLWLMTKCSLRPKNHPMLVLPRAARPSKTLWRWMRRLWQTASLVVHPLSYCEFWHDGDPGAARGAVPPSATPDKGVLVRVPVCGGAPDGFFDLGPGF